jgi:hypothetical protein
MKEKKSDTRRSGQRMGIFREEIGEVMFNAAML